MDAFSSLHGEEIEEGGNIICKEYIDSYIHIGLFINNFVMD